MRVGGNNMEESKTVKKITRDIDKTIEELSHKGILIDCKKYFKKRVGKDTFEISYPQKNDKSKIVFDKNVTSSKIIDTLLSGLQYNVLFYDKGFIQAEFKVKGDEIIKERLVFMKKHNKIWDKKEIEEYEKLEQDWFSEECGVPIMLRVDFAPDEHVDCVHAATHLTLSNHESCRIPIKGIVTFSEFVRFVLFHFYDIKMDLKVCRSSSNDTITELERKMIHLNWNQ